MKTNLFFSLLLLTPFAAHTAASNTPTEKNDNLKFLKLTLETQMTFLENPNGVGQQLTELMEAGYKIATLPEKPGIVLETQDRQMATTYRRDKFLDKETNDALLKQMIQAIETDKPLNADTIITTLNSHITSKDNSIKSRNLAFLAYVSKNNPYDFAKLYDAAIKSDKELIISLKK